MFRSFVAAVTLLALLACPFRCAAGGCGAASEANADCHCCAAASTGCDSGSETPVESPDADGCQCQGICGGAVVPDAPGLDAAVVLFAPLMNEADASPAVSSVNDDRRCDREGRRAKRHGATLRIAIASLLN